MKTKYIISILVLIIFGSIFNSISFADCYTRFGIDIKEKASSSSDTIGEIIVGQKLEGITSIQNYTWEKYIDGWIWINGGTIVCNPSNSELNLLNEKNKQALKNKIIYEEINGKKLKESLKKDGKGFWKIKYFTDEFGDPTKNRFLEINTKGVFSNSATSESDLFIQLMITKSPSKKDICFWLQEYNIRQPYEYFIRNDGIVIMKNSNGNKIRCNGTYKWNNYGGIGINHANKIIDFLKRSIGYVKVIIYGNNSIYKFEINANGFTKQYEKL